MPKQQQEVYVVEALRTAVGKAPRGVFSYTRPDDLLAYLIKVIVDKYPTIAPDLIEDVIIGCAMPEAEQGMNVARISLLLAGLPVNVPGMTINRFCSSGIQSIALAADKIALGEADIILAGGTESMSMVPMGGNKFVGNQKFFTNEKYLSIAYSMGITAEKVAQKWGITREMQEQFALQSNQRAILAIEQGLFKDEIVPYPVHQTRPDLDSGKIIINEKIVDTDEGPRGDTSLEKMATLKPSFALKGTVTAATSSQMSDGAGITLLMGEKMLRQYNLKPLAKLKAFSVVGVEPKYMGIGPAVAIPKALEQAKLKINDIDWIELNEAFAAQALAVINELNLPMAKVNPQGGAIALGHPLGATGTIRTATLLHGMVRNNLKYGMVTMCIGTGMGAAAIFERVD